MSIAHKTVCFKTQRQGDYFDEQTLYYLSHDDSGGRSN